MYVYIYIYIYMSGLRRVRPGGRLDQGQREGHGPRAGAYQGQATVKHYIAL